MRVNFVLDSGGHAGPVQHKPAFYNFCSQCKLIRCVGMLFFFYIAIRWCACPLLVNIILDKPLFSTNRSFCFPYFWFAGCGNLSTALFSRQKDIYVYTIKSMNIPYVPFFRYGQFYNAVETFEVTADHGSMLDPFIYVIWTPVSCDTSCNKDQRQRSLVKIESELRCHHLNWMDAASQSILEVGT